MGSEREFFDNLARPGDGIFEFVGSSQRVEYLQLVSRIYKILASLHNRVANVVVKVGEARNEQEVARILQALDADRLRQQLKAQNLCNELERLGIQLREALPKTIPAGPGAETLRQLSAELEGRERRTAEMYAVRLWDLRSLAWSGTPATAPLDDIKRKASTISEELLIQKAGFDLMQKRAREKLRRAR